MELLAKQYQVVVVFGGDKVESSSGTRNLLMQYNPVYTGQSDTVNTKYCQSNDNHAGWP